MLLFNITSRQRQSSEFAFLVTCFWSTDTDMSLPPGLLYLFHNLPSVLLPPSLVFISHKIGQSHLDIVLPIWAVVVAAFLSLPFALFFKVSYANFKNARDAEAHGAVLPPQVYDPIPGSVSLLMMALENFKTGYPGDMFVEWAQKYGNIFNFKILFENRFFTCEPEHIKAILATQFDNFEKGPQFQEQMKAVLGTGVFNSDGEMWKFHRAMTRPFFSKDRISHFDIFDRHAADALGQLRARLREGHPVDIQDLASRFTMDSATEFLFSQDVRSLDAGLPYPYYSPLAELSEARDHPANKFSRAFDDASFINPILAAAVKRKRENSKSSESTLKFTSDREVKEGETLLDHLINYTDDETVLRDEILNILLAGRDTTTNSITFATYMLAEHPDVFQKLRQEILEKVGDTKRPTFDDMRDMKYLRAVINETLRLYPAVPFNIRTTSKPVILKSNSGGRPFYLPANSKAPYSIFLMHRRTDLWGPDAHNFDPDRFLDNRVKKYITPNPFIFLPFNAGPRICLGQQFAYHETSFFLIRLLQQFASIMHVPEAHPPVSRPPMEWKNGIGTKGRDKIRMKSYMTMSVMGGCWVRMEEATPTGEPNMV
ncbi:cytochrome P450 monooxygenase pc-3 [Crucibulum laeve]|uniref:Cytochrome P450 monooxygenase pc-3 n=1 Tax=Crucibulum laeve TaxID=68775 RepID=A0A5C3LR23_9AGAR|nr:cytochrome P450 monooxygenase pc-3 [Crucibulum laeve]